MPSKKQPKTTVKRQLQPTRALLATHPLFWPTLIFVFAIWIAYRYLTAFPVWFDETVAKLIFFGVPVWFYAVNADFKSVANLFEIKKLWSGLFTGLAVGGIFGFMVVIMRLLQAQVVVNPAPIFLADRFWSEMLLGLFTSFWETLFFFGFVAGVVLHKYRQLAVIGQAVLVMLVFVLFHLPNTLIRFQSLQQVLAMTIILSLFALGQFLVYHRRQNGYTLVLSQLVWGLALLVYGW